MPLAIPGEDNMPNVTMTLEEYEALRDLITRERESEGASLSQRKKSFTRRRKPRKLSAWNKHVKNKKNHIKFKSGKRKGQLDLKKMSRAFKRSRK
jgi:hypothetical protein